MVSGLRDALSTKVELCDDAERVVFALRPNLIKGWTTGQNPALLTMWETNWLPPQFSEYLHLFDTVIVPSMHNWELFSQFHDNVRVIPLGVDRDVWFPKARPENEKFRILCGGSEWYRKGLDVVLKAFLSLKLFDAELHIKIVPPHLSAPDNLVYPNVVVHDKWMTVEAEADLVRSADCFVSVSRGEGFGLMPLQAIASGIPTIVSDSSGQAQFAHLAFGVVPCGKSKAETTGQWDEPNQKILEELMMEAYRNRGSIKQVAISRIPETKAFSWSNATRRLLSLIPEGTLLDDPDWVSPDVKVEIQVNRKVKADIGNESYSLEPGQIYVVSDNVHQVLTDAGYVV
jgi:glycosyltransferase involved in cell wall biosynthesis